MTREFIRRKRATRKAQSKRNHVVDNEFGALIVSKTRRMIRVGVVLKLDRLESDPPPAGLEFIDLDDDAVDRLIKRLTLLRNPKARGKTMNREFLQSGLSPDEYGEWLRRLCAQDDM